MTPVDVGRLAIMQTRIVALTARIRALEGIVISQRAVIDSLRAPRQEQMTMLDGAAGRASIKSQAAAIVQMTPQARAAALTSLQNQTSAVAQMTPQTRAAALAGLQKQASAVVQMTPQDRASTLASLQKG